MTRAESRKEVRAGKAENVAGAADVGNNSPWNGSTIQVSGVLSILGFRKVCAVGLIFLDNSDQSSASKVSEISIAFSYARAPGRSASAGGLLCYSRLHKCGI
jgi:hypothetical protein